MKPKIPIFLDRLRNEGKQKIFEELPPSFLEVAEEELTFSKNLTVEGKAYLANDYLIIQLDITFYPIQPCCICNEKFEHEKILTDFTHTEELAKIRGRVFDLAPLIRETVLVQIPQFYECSEGKCPERGALKNFF